MIMIQHNEQIIATYPNWIGFIFIFNIIVGTGALTLPAVFAKAGWLLSIIVIILLATISYMTVTFTIETMAAANAVKTWQNLQVLKRYYDMEINGESHRKNTASSTTATHNSTHTPIQDNIDDIDDDPAAFLLPKTLNRNVTDTMPFDFACTAPTRRSPIYAQRSVLMYYNLDKKLEMGEMAALFFNSMGRITFYLCVCVYLYGDLSIYSAAVAKSLRDVFCDHLNSSSSNPSNNTTFLSNHINNNRNLHLAIESSNLALSKNETDEDAVILCWHHHTLTRLNVYRLFLIGFVALFGPFVAFSVHKTKYLQIFTAFYRWCAFTFMISIAIKLLIVDGVKGHPRMFNLIGLPSLFGACVYSFMCHHSLPSLLVPIRNKKAVLHILGADYLIICLFYIVLSITGIFAFDKLEDLYTLNFIPDQTDDYSFRAELLVTIDYILALFPVLTLSASYPIIAITLRNNLQTLFIDASNYDQFNLFIRRILFPLMAVLPPLFITFFTESVINLVAFTGTYAGTGIQFIMPIILVYYARSTCRELLGSGVINEYKSPFRSNYWLIFVFLWAMGCLTLVTINLFMETKI